MYFRIRWSVHIHTLYDSNHGILHKHFTRTWFWVLLEHVSPSLSLPEVFQRPKSTTWACCHIISIRMSCGSLSFECRHHLIKICIYCKYLGAKYIITVIDFFIVLVCFVMIFFIKHETIHPNLSGSLLFRSSPQEPVQWIAYFGLSPLPVTVANEGL